MDAADEAGDPLVAREPALVRRRRAGRSCPTGGRARRSSPGSGGGVEERERAEARAEPDPSRRRRQRRQDLLGERAGVAGARPSRSRSGRPGRAALRAAAAAGRAGSGVPSARRTPARRARSSIGLCAVASGWAQIRAGSSARRIWLGIVTLSGLADSGSAPTQSGGVVARLLPDGLVAPGAARRLRVGRVDDPLAPCPSRRSARTGTRSARRRAPARPAPTPCRGASARAAAGRGARARGGRPRGAGAGRGAGSGFRSRECVDCVPIRAQNRSFADGSGRFGHWAARAGAAITTPPSFSRRNDEGSRTETSAPHGRRSRRLALVLAGAAARRGARGKARRRRDQCLPQQVDRPAQVPAAGVACRRQRAAAAVERPRRRRTARPAGPVRTARRGPPDLPGRPVRGHAAVGTDGPSRGTCRGAAWHGRSRPRPTARHLHLPSPRRPREAPPNVVLNEIDYDQVGADAGGFVELYNAGRSAAELDGLALVFVDGADGGEYLRKPLSGSLARRRVPRRPARSRRTAPRRGRADTTRPTATCSTPSPTKGAIERAFIGTFGPHARRGQRRCRRPSPTRTRSPARWRGSRTEATPMTRRPTGRSRPPSLRARPMFPRGLAAPLRAHVRAPLRAGLGPALPLLGLESLVEPPFEVRQLALQLVVALPAVRRQRPVVERRLDRAVRLGAVGAIRETALGRELFDVAERLREAVRRLVAQRLLSRASSRAPRRRPSPSACAPRPAGACRAGARGAPARAAASCSSPSGRAAASRPRAPPGWRTPARCRARNPRSGTAPRAPRRPRRSPRARPTIPRAAARASPGVSTTSPPPGSRTSWRCRVVWRPSPSCSRIVCVASSSSPASVFTSVDLPTPEEPSSAIVRPGARWERIRSRPSPVRLEIAWTGTPKAIASTSSTLQLVVGAEVGLRQHDHGLGAALPGHRHVALQAAEVEVLVQRHDQEDGVDVGGEHLLLRGVQRDLAGELRPP